MLSLKKYTLRSLFLSLIIGTSGLVTACTGAKSPETENPETALEALDREIDSASVYMERYESRLQVLYRDMQQDGNNPKKRLENYQELADAYLFYQADSALNYLNRALAMTRTAGNDSTGVRLLCKKASLLGMCGLPWEGERLLDSLLTTTPQPEARLEIFKTYIDVADYFYGYELPAQYVSYNYARLEALKDSLIKYDTRSTAGLLRLNYPERSEEQTLDLLKDELKHATSDNVRAAYAVTISNKYQKINNRRLRDYYWALSARYNIRACRMDNEALIRLAQLMAEEGESERAKRYTELAAAQADFYNARSRKLELFALLRKVHLQERQDSQRRLVGLGVTLTIALGGGLFCTVRRNRQRRTEKQLRRQLETAEQGKATCQMQNEEQKRRLHMLLESMGHFLALSIDSIYEENMFRQSLINRLRNGDIKKVLSQLQHPSDTMPGNPHKLRQQFDIAFCRLYPDFAQRVNELLQPDSRIALPRNELMNNELRLLALMRMGIADCQRMATILGISVNTVYFYRNRLKNHALRRETFEKEIMDIRGL